ncbi:hypothetical protein CROQUDRAFT_130990 [Cronartium quercuum f. sp. fusiforme G11]|uniref:Uncharacterized protein n=1 Tax=Cronartium quercuum f. sp. fusiforme G11 TaxID=708437 RepID=A0A9P6NMC8_9BASI|nr:hypothetical protein CROQUDRAFT_130990 [Cronartium quercuum f. sp. fusiforme G11]
MSSSLNLSEIRRASQIELVITPNRIQTPDLILEIPQPIIRHSRYVAHFMDHQPIFQIDNLESPTQSRYHHRKVFSCSSAMTKSEISSSSNGGSPESLLLVNDLAILEKVIMNDELVQVMPDDTLHNISADPYPRYGPSRYIIETDTTLTLWSKRGWLNFGSLLTLILVLITLFAVYPVYNHFKPSHKMDPITQSFFSRGGPFTQFELPQSIRY